MSHTKVTKGGYHSPPPSPASSFHFEYGYARLPKNFPDLNDIKLPVVRDIGIRACIEKLAVIFKCEDYVFNLLHFWFLDIVTDCIWMTQDKFNFPEHVQKTVLGWLLFAIDLIRDPSKSLSRKEFLDVLRETVCVAAELIEEGCYDVPVPLKMVSIPDKTARSMESTEINSTKTVDKSEETISKKTSDDILSFIELKNDEETNVYLLKKERCICSESSDLSTATKESSFESVSSKETKELKTVRSSIHDFYKADYNTPPRFKSLSELPQIDIHVEEEREAEEEENEKDTMLLELVEASSRESLRSTISKKVYVVFHRPSYSSVSTENNNSILENKNEEIISAISKLSKDKKIKKTKIQKKEEENTNLDRVETPDSEKFRRHLEALKANKIWEQRKKDLADSKVGLEPWQFDEENKNDDSEVILSAIEDEIDSDLSEEIIDDEILELLNKNSYDMNEKEYLSFGLLWSIIDFIYSYFSDTFQYSLVKIALTAPPNIITQNINDTWRCPKLLIEDMTKHVKDIKDKYKRIPVKKKKEKPKKEKKTKEKKVKEKKEKVKKEKTPKLSKAEKKALKEAEKLRKKQEKEEQERLEREEMSKNFLFPLQDASLNEEFFISKFPSFKPKKGKKGKKA